MEWRTNTSRWEHSWLSIWTHLPPLCSINSFFAESRLYDTWSGYIWLRKCTACCFLRSAVCLTALCERDWPELTLNYVTNSGVFDCYVLWSWVKLTLTAIQSKDYLTTRVGSYVYIDTVQSKPCRLTFDPLKVMRLVNAEQLIWFELSPRVQCGNRAAPRQPQRAAPLGRMFSDDAAEMLSNDWKETAQARIQRKCHENDPQEYALDHFQEAEFVSKEPTWRFHPQMLQEAENTSTETWKFISDCGVTSLRV